MNEQAFCETQDTDPTQHQRWLDKHGFVPNENGEFSVTEFEGKLPITVDQMFDNIRRNVSEEWWEPLYTSPYDERTFVMICGGPSLADHLEEIRSKCNDREHFLVACSNMTGAYLLENDIVPHVHFILDPQERKKFDIAPGKTHKDVEYWMNVACHPQVFETLKEQGIKPKAFLADFDSEGKAREAVKESLPPGQQGMMAIQGGTMAGLRAINLADAMGFRKFEYYGFDATVELKDGKARPYAYEKKRGEAIIEVTCDRCPEKFATTLIFQRQVNEFAMWRQNMPWIDFTIHGPGLMAHSLQHMKEFDAAKVHAPYRYSPEYAEMQRSMHSETKYGVSGMKYLPSIFHAVCQLAKRLGKLSVLDYGCAQGNTLEEFRKHYWLPPEIEFRNYDPFVERFSAEPEPADVVLCTDMMEHVEPECTRAVLDHIQALTKRVAFFSISIQPAVKKLSDGRNAHINLRTPEAWLKEIQRRFIISEATVAKGEVVLAVAQSVNDVQEVLRSRRQNGTIGE